MTPAYLSYSQAFINQQWGQGAAIAFLLFAIIIGLVGRMKEGQEAIYYITADGFAAARHSPHLEIFRKLGGEVLLMFDRVDEWGVSMLTEFDGKPLHSVATRRRRSSTLRRLSQSAVTRSPRATFRTQVGPRATAIRLTWLARPMSTERYRTPRQVRAWARM